jgi:hypothetical protein
MPITIQILLASRQNKLCQLFYKHHSTAHHIKVRKEFLIPLIVLEMLQQKQQQFWPVDNPAA